MENRTVAGARHIFKRCPACGFEWPTRIDFMADTHLTLIGYQVSFKQLTAGILLFNHSCKTTLAVQVIDFRDIYDGPVFKQRLTNSKDCNGHCMRQNDLQPCPAQCECAYVREIIQRLKHWPKSRASHAVHTLTD